MPQTKAAGAFVGTVRFGQNHNGISHSGCACEKGIKAIVISMDDYFVPGVIPPDENGRVDLEAPARVDCELLKKICVLWRQAAR